MSTTLFIVAMAASIVGLKVMGNTLFYKSGRRPKVIELIAMICLYTVSIISAIYLAYDFSCTYLDLSKVIWIIIVTVLSANLGFSVQLILWFKDSWNSPEAQIQKMRIRDL